jgi:hypothetical protein
MERIITYFEKPGHHNSQVCLDRVLNEVTNRQFKHIVVASTTGETGYLFAQALKDKGVNLVIVTHSYGFREPNHSEMSPVNAESIKAFGGKIYTGTMITHSLETALAKKFGGVYPTSLVALTLRRFGEGTKVCCEIVMMAADGGLIPEQEEVIAVAGTGRGADTVIIVQGAASKRFLDLKILEIIAKPRGE